MKTVYTKPQNGQPVLRFGITYENDDRTVFLLSPSAVATKFQGKGIGQTLIRHALKALKADGVDIAITYGDPAFYGKTGFQPITEDIAAAPLKLGYPHGWIGQSLDGTELTPLKGKSASVPALMNQAYW